VLAYGHGSAARMFAIEGRWEGDGRRGNVRLDAGFGLSGLESRPETGETKKYQLMTPPNVPFIQKGAKNGTGEHEATSGGLSANRFWVRAEGHFGARPDR
jgi:hypothetical protein